MISVHLESYIFSKLDKISSTFNVYPLFFTWKTCISVDTFVLSKILDFQQPDSVLIRLSIFRSRWFNHREIRFTERRRECVLDPSNIVPRNYGAIKSSEPISKRNGLCKLESLLGKGSVSCVRSRVNCQLSNYKCVRDVKRALNKGC